MVAQKAGNGLLIADTAESLDLADAKASGGAGVSARVRQRERGRGVASGAGGPRGGHGE